MQKNIKKEIARDFLALGSWIFFILVFARALIKPYRPFSDQMAVAGLILISAMFFIKNYDAYISRGIILMFFTTLFYQDKVFTIFAVLAIIGLIISSYYLEKSKLKIIKGLILGIIITLVSYYLANITLNIF